MEKINESMMIVFIGFDGYDDLWRDCFTLFNRFWPDCPYQVLFVNNELEVNFPNVEVLHAGKDAEWSRKVQVALKACESTYICLLLEDFFVGRRIDTNIINEIMLFMSNEDALYYKLANMSRAVRNHDPIYKGKRYLHIIPEDDEYGISLQAAIWNKEFLTEKIGNENYNAWKFEFDRVKEAELDNRNPRIGCYFDDRNVLNLKHGVVQSEFIPGTVRYFKRIGYPLNVEREILSYPQYYSIQAQSLFKYLMPKRMRRPVKKFLEKVGMKFVSTIRDDN